MTLRIPTVFTIHCTSPKIAHSFIIFHLLLFLKIQYPTHGHIREPPSLHCFPGLCLWKHPNSDRCASARPRPQKPFAIWALQVPRARVASSPYPTPNNYPFPRAPPQARSLHLCAPFIPYQPPPPSTRSFTYSGHPQSPRPPSSGLCVPDAPGSEKRKRAPPPASPLLEPATSPPRCSLRSPRVGRRPASARPFPCFPPLPAGGLGIAAATRGRSASRSTPTSPGLQLFAPPRSALGRVRANQPAHRARARAGANLACEWKGARRGAVCRSSGCSSSRD